MDLKLLHHLQNEKKLSEADLKKAQTRTEAKCHHIINALSKCFDLACSNMTSTNKRYLDGKPIKKCLVHYFLSRFLVTIDVTAETKKAVCIGNKVLTLLEAAVAYTTVLLRAEKDVVIATYKDDKIELLKVERSK